MKNKKCLIVVDYQNDFVVGSLGFEKAKEIEGAIAQKIRTYLNRGDEVLFTLDTHTKDYMNTQEGKNLPICHCVKGTSGHGLYGEIDVLSEGRKKFEKPAFGSDELYEYLKKTKFDAIELIGVVTNICVISNAVLAKTAQPETPVSVDKTCVASNSDYLQESALAVMESLQIKITGGEK